MQVPSSLLYESPQYPIESAVESTPEPVKLPDLIPDLIYDLRVIPDGSDGFSADVVRFSDKLLAECDSLAGGVIHGYGSFTQSALGEPVRSHGEYAIELLTMGLALWRYEAAARTSPRWAVALARKLFSLRKRSARIKPVADFLRARVTRIFLMPRIAHSPLPCHKSEACERTKPCSKSRHKQRVCPRFKIDGTGAPPAKNSPIQPGNGQQLLDGLLRLIQWLQATGEFEQETARLANWWRFLATLPPASAAHWIETAANLFDWFQREAEVALGPYTRGVPRFLAVDYHARRCREDQIFCGKEPVEYQLSMVAFEIVNRGLREDFERKTHKAVLIPACMRGPYATFCKARTSDTDIQCAACSPGCTVNRITRRMRALGTKVFLVPHATGFSRWLERWQREPDTGVVAVACLLNILPGGYEMRARGIASQCVPLDYPGCQKHWRSDKQDEIGTSVNEYQLIRLIQPAPTVATLPN